MQITTATLVLVLATFTSVLGAQGIDRNFESNMEDFDRFRKLSDRLVVSPNDKEASKIAGTKGWTHVGKPASPSLLFPRFFLHSGYVNTAVLAFDEGVFVETGTGAEFRKLDGTERQAKVAITLSYRLFSLFSLAESMVAASTKETTFGGSAHVTGGGSFFDAVGRWGAVPLGTEKVQFSVFNAQLDLSVFLNVPPTTTTAPAGLSAQNAGALQLTFMPASFDFAFTAKNANSGVEFLAGISLGLGGYFEAAADPQFQQVNVVYGFGHRVTAALKNPIPDAKTPIEIAMGTYFVYFQTPDLKRRTPQGHSLGTYVRLDSNKNVKRNSEEGLLVTVDSIVPFTKTLSVSVGYGFIVAGKTNPWSISIGVTLSFDQFLELLGLKGSS